MVLLKKPYVNDLSLQLDVTDLEILEILYGTKVLVPAPGTAECVAAVHSRYDIAPDAMQFGANRCITGAGIGVDLLVVVGRIDARFSWARYFLRSTASLCRRIVLRT
jgi:hypothetical protein